MLWSHRGRRMRADANKANTLLSKFICTYQFAREEPYVVPPFIFYSINLFNIRGTPGVPHKGPFTALRDYNTCWRIGKVMDGWWVGYGLYGPELLWSS